MVPEAMQLSWRVLSPWIWALVLQLKFSCLEIGNQGVPIVEKRNLGLMQDSSPTVFRGRIWLEGEFRWGKVSDSLIPSEVVETAGFSRRKKIFRKEQFFRALKARLRSSNIIGYKRWGQTAHHLKPKLGVIQLVSRDLMLGYLKLMIYLLIGIVFFSFLLCKLRIRWRQKRLQRERLMFRIQRLELKNGALLNALQELRCSSQELDNKLKLRNLTIAVFSHDISGPLRFMVDISSALVKRFEDLGEIELVKELKVLRGGASNAYNTASNILVWMKNPYVESKNRERNLNDIFEAVIHRKKSDLDHHKLKLDWNARQQYKVIATPGSLEIIIDNLLQNAIKFACSRIKVELSQGPSPKWIRVDIQDDGIGVHDLDKLRRINSGMSVRSSKGFRHEEGAGLGLLIVWEIVRQLKGSIKFENLGMGFRVEVLLPRAS